MYIVKPKGLLERYKARKRRTDGSEDYLLESLEDPVWTECKIRVLPQFRRRGTLIRIDSEAFLSEVVGVGG